MYSNWLNYPLSVTDQTDDGVFVAFDTEIARLTNIQAAEAAQILVRPPMNHIKLAYANHFLVGLTVSRIITEHERAHLPAFVNDVSTLYFVLAYKYPNFTLTSFRF